MNTASLSTEDLAQTKAWLNDRNLNYIKWLLWKQTGTASYCSLPLNVSFKKWTGQNCFVQ